jgi:hypothetical protein
MKSELVILVALVMISIIAVPVFAGTPNHDGTCIVPPDDYFIKDAPNLNGQPIHEGIQNGFTFWIPNNDNYPYFQGGYLHMTFQPMFSHADQTKIAMGHLWYCDSLPDVPYQPVLGVHTVLPTGSSENPVTSIYVPAHAENAALFK